MTDFDIICLFLCLIGIVLILVELVMYDWDIEKLLFQEEKR